ncbi:MAG: hypothetical protein NTX53_00550 [candidate division WOR-3 bacterium]|nr:hypothetical protein [candidate division WOR-3 bacterium]
MSTLKVVLAAGCLLVAACMVEDLGPMPALQTPQWQDGETSVYQVTRNDSAVYRSTVTLAFDEEIGSEDQDDSVRVVPTLVATNVVEPLSDAEYYFDSVQVVFRRDDVAPLRAYRSVETDISEFEISARYGRGRVQIEKQTIDGSVQQELRLPGRFHSYDMIQTWLRCIPLVSGTTFRDNLVVPLEFRTVPVKVLVLGTKLVTTGVGDIMCREIVLILPNREVKFWYELAQPHRFVGLSDAQNATQMLLQSYQPAHADSLPAAP